MQAAAGMGGGHPRQQFQHRIHYQVRQGFACGVDNPHPWIAQPHQGEQLAFLVVMGAGHQGDLAAIHRQGGHHQHIQLQPLGGGVPTPLGLEAALQLAKTERRHRWEGGQALQALNALRLGIG